MAASELSAELLQIAKVCRRLDKWVSIPSGPDSPLVKLVNDSVRHLVAATEYFSTQITHPEADLQTASINIRSLFLVKKLLSDSLSLLDFSTHKKTDLHGNDGAINAVYASMFLARRSQQGESGQTISTKVKLARLANEVNQIVSLCYDPHARSSGELWAELANFAHKNEDTFYPRYIHSYPTSVDLPYIIDKSTAAASGSFGTVRKVFHKTTGESFAAKSFHNVLRTTDRKKILRELGCLELCNHHNLITLVEAFELKDDPHTITIVMTPWAPSTLWNFLLATDARRKTEFLWFEPNLISSDRCIYHIMLDIVAAVAFLHERSIKHKDIKPQNILMYREAKGTIRPIVTDVGESKVYRAGAATEPKRSSYEYLAPEQQLETKDMQSSLKSDVWQLGCCFAMLIAVARSGLSGLEKLWNSFTNTAENSSCNIANESVCFMATLQDICSPGSIPQEHACWVVVRMLDKNPTTRFNIQNVMIELERLSEMAGHVG